MIRKSKYFLGCDPSFSGCAFIIINNKSDKPISQKLVVKKNGDIKDLYSLVNPLNNIVKEFFVLINKYEPEIIAIENFSYGSKNSLASQGLILGVLLLTMKQSVVRSKIIFPAVTTVKAFLGKGNMKKDLILLKVFKRFKVEFEDDNLADAYTLAQIAKCFYNQRGFTKNEIERVKRIGK